MRVSRWRAHDVLFEIELLARQNGDEVLDDVVTIAKSLCPMGTISREGKFVSGTVSITPRKGRNKGKTIKFDTARRWTGREPGDLENSIRHVKSSVFKPGRVYAGNFMTYWALMVERGTVNMPKKPYLRPALNAVKRNIINRIKYGV